MPYAKHLMGGVLPRKPVTVMDIELALLLTAFTTAACGGTDGTAAGPTDAGSAGEGGPIAAGGRVSPSGGASGLGGAGGAVPQGIGGRSAGNGGTDSGGSGGSAVGADGGPPEAGSGGGSLEGGQAAVRVVGRHEVRGSDVLFSWSGSGLRFRFEGTGATVRLDDQSGFFTLVVDGERQAVLETSPGANDYEILDLPQGEHEIELYRRTEPSQGLSTLLGVTIQGGSLLPISAPTRRMEVIGNSITCGYGNEGPGPNCPFSADTENHYLAYASLAARNLGAELHTIAWSGKGIVYNYGDDTFEPLPSLYARALGADGNGNWDFSRWQADVVVINLGTNDFSTDGDPTEMLFKDAYRGLLGQVRAAHPGAWILCLTPTGIGGGEFNLASEYISDVVDALRTEGDERIAARNLQFDSTGYGCDYHPSLDTHESMALALETELENLVGW